MSFQVNTYVVSLRYLDARSPTVRVQEFNKKVQAFLFNDIMIHVFFVLIFLV